MTTPKNGLTQLPNIGKVLAEKLKLAEIETAGELKMVGAENAFIRLVAVDEDVCIQMLWALEGAVRGIRWHDLSESRKRELKEFYSIATK